ncbi:MAG: ABC transporter ATP-binding protein/permease [Saprospiraceae bacterium]|nr:ABC transporter ATP-binding protein/permease [Saprospiraceae bacterium]
MRKSQSTDFALLRRVLATAYPFRNEFITSIVLAVLVTPFSVAQPFLIQKMVDDHISAGNREGILQLAWVFVVVLIVSVVLKYWFLVSTARLGQSVIQDMRNKVYRHITNLRLRYFDQTPVGISTTRTINDVEAINNVFAQGVITIVADFLTLGAVVAMMIYTSWRLTLIVCITMPFMVLATYIFKEKVKVSYQKVRTQIASMNAFLQERISGMKTVQILHAEEKEAAVFRRINRDYTSANLDSVFYYAVFFPVVELVSAVSLALMIWLGARGYLEDKVTFGSLVAFPLYLNLMFRPIRFMADKFNTLQMGLVAAERVFKVLDHKETIPDKGMLSPSKLEGKVTFEHVTFSYDGEQTVLHDISFTILPGQTCAIVGRTGSGKSTIIQLLSRLYDLQQGNILIDHAEIQKYKLKELRKRMAIVLQDVFLFQGSVLDNITLRDPSVSREQVIRSAKAIGADDFIEKLPGKYDFILNERGQNLSVGQRQLISFVRALVTDPDILILDEATASIDTESERIIQHAIEKLIERRTSIIIAHRLSTIRHADNVLVLQQGNIVEQGHPSDLLADENGFYRKLYDMQFAENMQTN